MFLSIPRVRLPGVYCIENQRNAKKYIGSTRYDIFSRLKRHEYLLKTGQHPSKELQADFDRGDDFCLYALKTFERQGGTSVWRKVLAAEHDAIVCFCTLERGYNRICPTAYGTRPKVPSSGGGGL